MKKALSLFIFIILAMTLSVTAFAAEIIASGYCGGEGDGTNLEWKIDSKGVITISGEGKMADYPYSHYMPWVKYRDNITEIVIEDGVTSIGKYAFYNSKGTKGTIGKDVASIGEQSFMNCDVDEYYFKGDAPSVIPGNSPYLSFEIRKDILYYPEGNTTWKHSYGNWKEFRVKPYSPVIASGYCGGEGDGTNLEWELASNGTLTISGNGAMEDYYSVNNSYSGKTMAPWINCGEKITSLVIENGVTTIGNHAFYECSDIAGNLGIPASVTSIGSYAFQNCTGFTGELIIPSSVTFIEIYAFKNCSGFTGSLVIPQSLTEINEGVFQDCTGFDGTLTIPRGVTRITWAAFKNCSGFTGDLVIPEGIMWIGGYAFSDCTGFNGNLFLPESLGNIQEGVFYNCSGLKGDLLLSGRIWNIGKYAFSGCSGLDGYLTIGEEIEIIGEKAFENCNLKGRITFGEKLTNIGAGAFSTCDNLKKFVFFGEAPVVIAAEYENRSFRQDAVLYYTPGWNYWTSPEWNGYTAVPYDAPDVLYGDVDGNGKINVIDANLVRRYAAELIDFTEEQLTAADVDGNGKVNVIDANLIRRYAAELIDKFPVEG